MPARPHRTVDRVTGILETVSLSPRGVTLAELAYLEAASILAFTELATQLERLGAPAELIERCHAATGSW